MTTTKKLRLLKEFIDAGRGDECVVIYQDALKYEFEGRRSGDKCYREQFTVSDIYEQVKANPEFEYAFSFKELFKNIERNKITYVPLIYKDTVDGYEEAYRQKQEKQVGDIYTNYQKENNGE